MDVKKNSYYYNNLIKYKKYYEINRDKKLEYQKDYNARQSALYEEMKKKFINYNVVIRPPKKRDFIGIKVCHGSFEVEWD